MKHGSFQQIAFKYLKVPKMLYKNIGFTRSSGKGVFWHLDKLGWIILKWIIVHVIIMVFNNNMIKDLIYKFIIKKHIMSRRDYHSLIRAIVVYWFIYSMSSNCLLSPNSQSYPIEYLFLSSPQFMNFLNY